MRARVLGSWLAAVVLLATGCAPSGTTDLVGTWEDAAGQPQPDGSHDKGGVLVIHTFLASSQCSGPKDTVYLELAWPPGRAADESARGDVANTRYYVRGDSIERRVVDEPYAADVTAPASARSTGFIRQGNVLSVDPAGSAYVRRPSGRTERWPQIELGCA